MNTFTVVLIAAILAMASSAPDDKKVIKKYAENGEKRYEWQTISDMEDNLDQEHRDIIISRIFDIFPCETDDRMRMQELMTRLDHDVSLGSLCPPGNNWSMLGFKLCVRDYVLGNVEGKYVVFHYSNNEDEDGAGYALYNDCK